MNKKFYILIIIVLSMNSLFANKKEVKLITTITPTDIEYGLYYQTTEIVNKTKNFEIQTTPLTENGKTDSFYIVATSNLNSDKALKIKINPGEFKKVNAKQATSNTKIRPIAIFVFTNNILHAGQHNNEKIAEFYLKWNGDSNLAAGEYLSNVKINYSIK